MMLAPYFVFLLQNNLLIWEFICNFVYREDLY